MDWGTVAWVAWALVMALGSWNLERIRSLARRIGRWRCRRRPVGCCTSCKGTGSSYDVETNGRCWDCHGTGHTHMGA